VKIDNHIAKSIEEGIPYQSLISMLIHKYNEEKISISAAFNLWVAGFADLYRNRTDEQGVMCIACHNSTHAVYGAENKYGKQRDNMQPLQYQRIAGTIGTHEKCKVCHIKNMSVNWHHRSQVMRKVSAAIVE
jgi:hypothetical protein